MSLPAAAFYGLPKLRPFLEGCMAWQDFCVPLTARRESFGQHPVGRTPTEKTDTSARSSAGTRSGAGTYRRTDPTRTGPALARPGPALPGPDLHHAAWLPSAVHAAWLPSAAVAGSLAAVAGARGCVHGLSVRGSPRRQWHETRLRPPAGAQHSCTCAPTRVLEGMGLRYILYFETHRP